MKEKSARVVSLVPSWTETLIWAGINVVGRTRFCIHPDAEVAKITIVGGTKGVDIEKLISLKPDYVILDREENNKVMAEQLEAASIKMLVSQVQDRPSAAQFLTELAQIFQSHKLKDLANRYLNIQDLPETKGFKKFFEQALVRGNFTQRDLHQVEYVIWKNPYMVMGQNTFIADVLKIFGIELQAKKKYLEISEEELKKNFCLLSTEPYPFHKDFEKMLQQGFKAVLVDGEKISWYGIRNLIFLESCVK